MDFYVYILKCSDGSYYVGHTDDIDKRIGEHQSGLCQGYVAARLPMTVVFVECCASRAEALEAERKIKGWSRWKKELLITWGWEGMESHKKKYKKGSSIPSTPLTTFIPIPGFAKATPGRQDDYAHHARTPFILSLTKDGEVWDRNDCKEWS